MVDLTDLLGYLRYGMPTSQKEALAASGALPGAPKDNTVNQDAANRYAAGFLFQRAHPTLAPIVQPLVNQIKTSTLPLLGGSSPELQSQATAGANAAAVSGPDALRAALMKIYGNQGAQ